MKSQILSSEEIKNILENTLPEYKRISEAPNRADFEERAEKQGRAVEELLRHEAEKRYKACDRNGNVYLVINPAAWTESTDENGRLWRHRPNPLQLDNLGGFSQKQLPQSTKELF